MRWKTGMRCQFEMFCDLPGDSMARLARPESRPGVAAELTLLDAVLVGLAVLLLLLLDALSALIVVVLERGALLGLHALCGEC